MFFRFYEQVAVDYERLRVKYEQLRTGYERLYIIYEQLAQLPSGYAQLPKQKACPVHWAGFPHLRLLKLDAVQIRKNAVVFKQFRVAALFGNAVFGHHNDAVRIADRR